MTTSHALARRFLLLSLPVVLAAMVPGAVSGQAAASHKLDALLRARSTQLGGRSRVIVEFHHAADQHVVTRQRGVVGRQVDSIRALVADVDNTALAAIAAAPGVSRVSLDRPVLAALERTGAAIGATMATYEFGLTGAGVGVAVIDSGIESNHDDLTFSNHQRGRASRRVVHVRDFTRENDPRVWVSEVGTDDYGHGTHVAGIIAGSGFASNGARTGVASEANLVSLKVLDSQGQGYVSDVIAAIDYAIEVKDTYNIRVVNLSVAAGVFDSYDRDPLTQATRRAVEAGIVVVAAAGNLGRNEQDQQQFGGITSPGNAPWVLTVGAASHHGTTHRADDTVARFSSLGPTSIDLAAKPDLVAPGVGIESLAAAHSVLYRSLEDFLMDGTGHSAFRPYLSLSGTSMAAPAVSGTVALMLEVNPYLTPNAVKALLQYTAEARSGEHALALGAGMLNAMGAVRLARFFADPSPGLPRMGDYLEGEWIAWGRHITWGNRRTDGGVPLPGSNAWALNVTWGDRATASGQPIVWGTQEDGKMPWGLEATNIVWSEHTDDNAIWSIRATNIVWSEQASDTVVWSTETTTVRKPGH